MSTTNSERHLTVKEGKTQIALQSSTQSKSKREVNVLDEDSFIDKLESIIERDFFPDLEKLKIQQAYYEAVRNNDTDSLRDLYIKYSSLLTRTNRPTPSTPAFFDTPVTKKKDKKEIPYANEEPPASGEINTGINNDKTTTPASSLDKFLAENTSEDNISFEVIMSEAEKKDKLKLNQSWLYDREKFLKLKQENVLMLENGNRGPDDTVTRALDSWTYTAKNTLMYIPEGVPLTDEEQLEKCRRIRVINHSNTRFNSDMLRSLNQTSSVITTPGSSLQNKMNPTINVITKIGVDGKEAVTSDTPKVRGYSFVDASPSPMPGRSLGDESPMMTWGEIESTPFRLEGSSTPYFGKIPGGPEFKIPEVPEREKIALNLEEKASAARRKKKNEAMKHVQKLASPSRNLSASSSPYSNSISDKINSMSPAAQRLLSTKLNIKLNDKSDSTPSPAVSASKTSSSPYLSLLSSPSIRYGNSTSSIDNLRSTLKRPSTSNSITDNLLKLPKNT